MLGRATLSGKMSRADGRLLLRILLICGIPG